jgi:hypothetical protein
VGASFPLISTSGGFPGEKKRSLTFVEVFSIDASSAGVENGAAAGAVAVAARPTAGAATAARAGVGTAFGGLLAVEDIEEVRIAQPLFRSYNNPGELDQECSPASVTEVMPRS